MILPRGITGFGRKTGAEVAPADFARACSAVARAGGGVVEGIEPPRCTRNYHRALVRLGASADAIAILCNAHFPWIAFAEAGDDLSHRFLEATDRQAARFRDALPCEVLDRAWLESPPDEAAMAELSRVERQQIRYWRPARIGDIIFNWWD